jgi:hypothetical protein
MKGFYAVVNFIATRKFGAAAIARGKFFLRTTRSTPPTSQREKFFAQNAFSGVSQHPMRRKTRESVPSDSL